MAALGNNAQKVSAEEWLVLPGFGMSFPSHSSQDWAVPQEHPRSVRFCIILSLIYKGSAVLSALRSGAACHGNIHPGLK